MGGSSSSTTTAPQYLQDADKENLARASEAAKIGYTPYYGPDVAAFTPQQVSAFNNTNQAAGAFGMQAPSNLGIPQAQSFAGGIQGYSSGGMYDQAIAQLQQRNPGQYAAIQSMFVDPQTGAAPTNKALAGLLQVLDATQGGSGGTAGMTATQIAQADNDRGSGGASYGGHNQYGSDPYDGNWSSW